MTRQLPAVTATATAQHTAMLTDANRHLRSDLLLLTTRGLLSLAYRQAPTPKQATLVGRPVGGGLRRERIANF